AFPSVRSFDNRHSKEVRQHFVPLFEKHHLKAAFEHHEHAYKRTKPINGVTYLGDGCWGVKNKRHPQANDSFAHTASTHHVFLLTIDNTRCTVEALAPDGTIFDSVTLD
ncbi:MAG: hypothetical protein KDK65_05020, partial [Chlamydiia bacterium]|nr:hypothetical protein [Chlamydiia bacterium]